MILKVSQDDMPLRDALMIMVRCINNSTSKLAFKILSPSATDASHPGLGLRDSLNCMQSSPQTIAPMSLAACQVSGSLCLFT